MGRATLRKVPHARHGRESHTKSKAGLFTTSRCAIDFFRLSFTCAGMKMRRGRSFNRISSSAYSPRRRAVHHLRLADRPNRDRGHHSHTKGLSRKSVHYRSYQDEDTYFDDMEDVTDSDAESKDTDFFWDEERTLFSDLMGEVYVMTCIYMRSSLCCSAIPWRTTAKIGQTFWIHFKWPLTRTPGN